MRKCPASVRAAAAALLACALIAPASTLAANIEYRSFSGSATMGPQAEQYAAKLADYTYRVLGPGSEVRFVKKPGVPPIPAIFKGDIVAAVGAGAAGGGFDAAYNSGSELNRSWGFIYNSGVPFGPNFDEHLGFLYGKSVEGGMTGLELIQSIMDLNDRNVVVLPIVASSEQLSGYFPLPIGNVNGMHGIGLAGLCQSAHPDQPWTLRYLPPGENVLKLACQSLVASGKIPYTNLYFIAAVPGGGSLVDAVKSGQLQGFEFATPLDDVSQLFNTLDNPGTVGVRYVHAPGWQQQFLITWMIINKTVWNSLTPAQQLMAQTVARDHVVSSYGENMRQQGAALKYILSANQGDGYEGNDMVYTPWPKQDQELLRDATIRFLNDRANDATLPYVDRMDYLKVLEAYRKYVSANDIYWDDRGVNVKMRFDDWTNADGEAWNK